MITRLQEVAAHLRLDRVELDPRAEARDHEVHFVMYVCPHCAAEARFSSLDFYRRFNSAESIFHPQDLARFDRFRARRDYGDLGPEACLDFYCAGCGAPVRLMFEGVELAMGCYMFSLTSVVEWADAAPELH